MRTYIIKPMDNLRKSEFQILEKKLTFEFIIKKLYKFYDTSSFQKLAKIIGVPENLEQFPERETILKGKCKELDLYNHIFNITEIVNFRNNIKKSLEKTKEFEKEIKKDKQLTKMPIVKDLINLTSKEIKKDKETFKKDIAIDKESANKIYETIINIIEELVNDKSLTEVVRTRLYLKEKRRLNAYYMHNISFIDNYRKKEIQLWIKRLSLKQIHTSINDYKLKKIDMKKIESLEKYTIVDSINKRIDKEINDSNDNIEDSLTFIKANINEFNSQASRAAISSLYMNSIRFPFPNATIYFYLDNKIHDTLFFRLIDKQVDFLINQEYTITLDITNIKKSIGSQLSTYTLDTKYNHLILNSLSVLQFMAFYEKDEEKIQLEKREQFIRDINESSLNEKPNIKNLHHIIKINTLNKSENFNGIGKRRESDGKWLVCGHMRHQKYKNEIKLIWIAPHWRGHGKNKISKTYKIKE